MIYRKQFTRIIVPLFAVLVLISPALSTEATKQLAPGVSLYQEINTNPGSALVVNVVTVDPANPAATVKAALGKDVVYVADAAKGRETISSLTGRRNALIGVNADFFPFTGDPLGICIIDGELVSEPGSDRVALGVPESGPAFFDNPKLDATLTLTGGVVRRVDGINRERETNQVVVYTGSFGAVTPGKYKGTEVVLSSTDLPVRAGRTVNLNVVDVRPDSSSTPIPKDGMVISAGGPAAWFLKENLKPGDSLSVRFDIKSVAAYDWSSVKQSVGGGPWLLKNGKTFIDYDAEGFGSGFSTARHPRTALGLTSENKLLIVTVDGRQSISRGINLPDLADLMKRLGAVDAINLDGGGSTTLSCKGIILNSPSGGAERPVADALLVFADLIPGENLPKLTINGVGQQVQSGAACQLTLTCGDQNQPLTADQLMHVVWGTTNGVGFVNQRGYFTPMGLRKGSIKAIFCAQSAGVDVSVVPGKPANLKVILVPDKRDPLRAAVTMTLADVNDNSIAGQQLRLEVTGGRADVGTGATDAKGMFTTSVTWDANATMRVVKAVAGELSSTSDGQSSSTGQDATKSAE